MKVDGLLFLVMFLVMYVSFNASVGGCQLSRNLARSAGELAVMAAKSYHEAQK